MVKKAALAVTGDVGAGKSTVARLFEGLGAILLNADAIVAELWRTPEVLRAAVERWGPGILDASGHVQPAYVAERLFGSRVEYAWGCALLHPLVKREMRLRYEAAERWVAAEIPMLFEAGVPDWVTATVFVTADRSLRLERCRHRGWDEAELARRELFFIPSAERRARSDYALENNGSLEDLRETICWIYEREVMGQCT